MEGVVAVDVEVTTDVQRQARDALVADGVAVGAQAADRGVEVDGVPQRDGTEHRATRRARREHHDPATEYSVAVRRFEAQLAGEGVGSRDTGGPPSPG